MKGEVKATDHGEPLAHGVAEHGGQVRAVAQHDVVRERKLRHVGAGDQFAFLQFQLIIKN